MVSQGQMSPLTRLSGGGVIRREVEWERIIAMSWATQLHSNGKCHSIMVLTDEVEHDQRLVQ